MAIDRGNGIVTPAVLADSYDLDGILAKYEEFDDLYLGKSSFDPTTDNDGDPLQAGALYFNTVTSRLSVYNGTQWESIGSTTLQVNNFTGNGSTIVYGLSLAPNDENATQVYIDGVYQQKNTYSVSSKNLTFSEAPPNLSDIEIMIITSFDIGETDAISVSYNQGDTNAVATTVEAKLQETVSVKDFGAVGDGVTNDVSAINNALAVGGIIDLGGLTYKINVDSASDVLKIKSNTRLQNGTFDFDGSTYTGGAYFTNYSITTQNFTLASDVAINSRAFTVTDSTYIKKGEIIKLKSSTAFSGDTNIEEVFEVHEVDGNIITINGITTYGYTTATTGSSFGGDTNITLDNVGFLGDTINPYDTARFVGVTHSNITNCYFDHTYSAHLKFYECDGISVDGCVFTDSTATGTAYGVVITATKNIKISNSSFKKMRHGVTVGGSQGLSDNVVVDGNTFELQIDAGVDSHSACLNMIISNNTIIGDNDSLPIYTGNADGITFQGLHCVIIGNTIKNTGDIGIYVQPTHYQDGTSATISGNLIEKSSEGAGIYLLLQNSKPSGTINHSMFSVSGNNVSKPDEDDGACIYVYKNTANTTVKGVSIIGNTILNNDHHGIWIRGSADLSGDRMENVVVASNNIHSTKTDYVSMIGIYFYRAENSIVNSNLINGVNTPNVGIRILNSTNITYANNMINGYNTDILV